MIYTSGYGALSSSGLIHVSTANAGLSGVSGSITMSSGTTTLGNSGYIYMATGNALSGTGGDIDMIVGSGEIGNGGNVYMVAGEAEEASRVGGWVQITGGLGSNVDSGDGGNGGAVFVDGGWAKGGNSLDLGGNVELTGGKADFGSGGTITIESGYGFATSSGELHLYTQNSGPSGKSGQVSEQCK